MRTISPHNCMRQDFACGDSSIHPDNEPLCLYRSKLIVREIVTLCGAIPLALNRTRVPSLTLLGSCTSVIKTLSKYCIRSGVSQFISYKNEASRCRVFRNRENRFVIDLLTAAKAEHL